MGKVTGFLEIDRQGKIRLSRKEALQETGEAVSRS